MNVAGLATRDVILTVSSTVFENIDRLQYACTLPNSTTSFVWPSSSLPTLILSYVRHLAVSCTRFNLGTDYDLVDVEGILETPVSPEFIFSTAYGGKIYTVVAPAIVWCSSSAFIPNLCSESLNSSAIPSQVARVEHSFIGFLQLKGASSPTGMVRTMKLIINSYTAAGTNDAQFTISCYAANDIFLTVSASETTDILQRIRQLANDNCDSHNWKGTVRDYDQSFSGLDSLYVRFWSYLSVSGIGNQTLQYQFTVVGSSCADVDYLSNWGLCSNNEVVTLPSSSSSSIAYSSSALAGNSTITDGDSGFSGMLIAGITVACAAFLIGCIFIVFNSCQATPTKIRAKAAGSLKRVAGS